MYLKYYFSFTKIRETTSCHLAVKPHKNKVRMNTDEESIKFYARCVFKYQEEAKMDFKTSVWPYLKFFLTEQERDSFANVDPKFYYTTRGYKRIRDIFLYQIKSEHGNKCIKFNKKKRAIFLKLEPAYKEDENDYVVPWTSDEFETYPDLVKQVIGFGKLAFTRTLWPEILPFLPHLKLYYHTAVTLFRQDGEVDLVEVKKCGNVVRFNKKKAIEIEAEEKTTKMFFDNKCLVRRRALDTKRTLFRVARILNKTINYNVTRFNCDHVSTWALTGRIAWTTALFEVDPKIPLPTFPGEVDERVLSEIEEQLQEPAANR